MTKSSHKLHIFITGANRGLGLALTKLLLEKGHAVTAVSRSTENLQHIPGEELTILQADLNTNEVEKVHQALGGGYFHVVINNAAMLGKIIFSESQPYDQEQVLNLNLSVPMNISRSFVNAANRPKGALLINICSVAGVPEIKKLKGLASYSASKAGLIAFSQTLAEEVAPEDCKVVPVIIGTMQTDMLQEALPGYSEGMTPQAVARQIGAIIEAPEGASTGSLYTISEPA